MHQRIFIPARRLARFLALALVSLGFTSGAYGQQGPRLVPVDSAAYGEMAVAEAVTQVLARGQELESSGRWGEALHHYEGALKQHPNHPDLQQRFTLARAHYDVTRRYADASYVASLRDISERQSLDLYDELLQKIHTHYVTAPDWQGLVSRGTLGLEVALNETAFRNQHLPQVDAARIDRFRDDTRRMIQTRAVRSPQEAREVVSAVARAASQQLGVSPAVVVLEYVCGAAGSLDTYSTYLTAGQLDELYSQIEGNFVGLGVELKGGDDGALQIVNAIAGSPAALAGIVGGDRITEVNGVPTKGRSTDEAADLLKGPEGSQVEVTVVAPNGQARRLKIIRQRVDVPSVDQVKMLDPQAGIAYFRINSFQKNTSRDVDAALWNLHRQGMQSLIIDVRGNPGGLLTASVEVADKFIAEGTIVSTRGRSPREDFDYKAHRVGTWRVPLVVLIDGDSASASEIFAGAIRDHRRGHVVGQRSYGKGSVQGIFSLHTARCGVRLTTAKFYSPSGAEISNRGVEPDVIIRTAAKPALDAAGEPIALDQAQADEDATLRAGVEAARRLIAQR